jgi:signal transduction histidine kinase
MKATLKTITANPTYTAAKTGAYTYLGFALYQSFSHIVELSVRYGCTNPWASPLLVDSLMLLGKLIRSSKVTKRARVVGGCLQAFGAIVSLLANIFAGQTAGDRVQGAAVIIGFLIVEWVVEQTKPVQVDEAAAKAAAKAAAIAKAQATRAANKAAARVEQAQKDELAEQRRERRRMARQIKELELTGALPADLPAAPVSPAPAGRTEPGYL